ncbi:MAG: amidinotransferase, partial [Planctomycetia bacterium]|nr:amidinotransferase [Planctomycetia bacterium]
MTYEVAAKPEANTPRTSAPWILMCPPDHFGIEYEINPWMSRARGSDPTMAREQWSALRATLETAGARVSLLEPVVGQPDLVFTANAAVIYRDTAIISHFRHP